VAGKGGDVGLDQGAQGFEFLPGSQPVPNPTLTQPGGVVGAEEVGGAVKEGFGVETAGQPER
jgi:hypothetical protein